MKQTLKAITEIKILIILLNWTLGGWFLTEKTVYDSQIFPLQVCMHFIHFAGCIEEKESLTNKENKEIYLLLIQL